MGRGYVIEHCISTLNMQRKEDAYKVYISEVLRSIAKSHGIKVASSYNDFINSIKPQKREERTADQVICSIREKIEKVRGEADEPAGLGSKNNS